MIHSQDCDGSHLQLQPHAHVESISLVKKLFSGGDTQLQNVFVGVIMGSERLLTSGIFITTTRLCLAGLSTNESPAHF